MQRVEHSTYSYSTRSVLYETMPRLKSLKIKLYWGVGLITTGALLALVFTYTPAPTPGEAHRHVAQSIPEGQFAPVLRGEGEPQIHLRRPVVPQQLQHARKYLSRTSQKRHKSIPDAKPKYPVQDIQERSEMQCYVQNREKPWYNTKVYSETYLVFFGKPIMEDLRIICSNRHWKMKHIPRDNSEGLQELKELISPDRFLIVFTVSSKYGHKPIRSLANSTNALVGTVGNASRVTGPKRTQLTAVRRYFRTFGCLLEDTDIMPRSFILDNHNECKQFFRYSTLRPLSWWVLKPSGGQGGDGITIHSNLTYFYRHYANCTTQPDAVVQEYITNLLLVKNRKFDIRAYIFLARTFPHFLVFYHEGYLRVSMKEFDIHGSRAVHLTSSHVQTSVEGFTSDDHIWSFDELQNYLNIHRPEDARGFVSNTLVPFTQKIGLLISHTG